MKNVLGLVIALLLCSVGGCDNRKPVLNGPCDGLIPEHICSVPYELVYSNFHDLLGRLVRIEGVLIVGVRPEPPGSNTKVALLFPSVERAERCNASFAVEVVPSSDDDYERLQELHGSYVSIAGIFDNSNFGHWASIMILKDPSPEGAAKGAFERCLAVPESKGSSAIEGSERGGVAN